MSVLLTIFSSRVVQGILNGKLHAGLFQPSPMLLLSVFADDLLQSSPLESSPVQSSPAFVDGPGPTHP